MEPELVLGTRQPQRQVVETGLGKLTPLGCQSPGVTGLVPIRPGRSRALAVGMSWTWELG